MISIDALPDDVLLNIFDSYIHEDLYPGKQTWAWQLLIHVCRRWRSVVFGSPRRLDLRLFCTPMTRSRDRLDIWPTLPLIIDGGEFLPSRVDNLVAALKCSDRVCKINLPWIVNNKEKYLAAMQQPFPELTHLDLWWQRFDEAEVVLDSLLGGFAPRLEFLNLARLPFPGLPKLLLSATHLVHLRLLDIPHSGYFSPDAMVAALSTLISLKELTLRFESPESCPDLETRRLPPLTRFVLPVLNTFQFLGASEYLEDLVTDIDAPQLNKLRITFFNDSVFDTPQLIRFISCTPMSSALALEDAHIVLLEDLAYVTFLSQKYDYVGLEVSILCEGLGWQLSFLEQVCTSCLPFLSTLKDLYIHYEQLYWEDDFENRVWLELLHPFTDVKNLYLSEKLAPLIGPALQELVEGRTTEVLPALQNIFLERFKSLGPVEEGIGQFVAARQVASHPVAISLWANSKEDKARAFEESD